MGWIRDRRQILLLIISKFKRMTPCHNKWDKVFKHGTSKLCGQPLKNLKRYNYFRKTLHLRCLTGSEYASRLLKGYLRYKTIFCHKVALDVYLMNFFIWRKNVSFSRYQDCCVFVKVADFKIWDVIISITG